MKKTLIRAGINAYDTKKAVELLESDFIGGNSGNLIYAHSLYRNLTTKDIYIESDNYKIDTDPGYINENYSSYIIPLADAFRPDFEQTLIQLTRLIKQLKIPVYLIGAGVKSSKNVKKEDLKFDFDNSVKLFISAILEKSSIVGLRGEITSDYLSNLGFREDRHHTVIGCPSMYTYGEHLKIREVPLFKEDKISLSTNCSKSAPSEVLKYISDLHKKYQDTSFIPQGLDEFKMMYTGYSTFNIPNYPSSIQAIEHSNGKSRFFVNASTWIDFLRHKDFSFGTKLHGNITATIAGTPSITIPIDARMKELVDYHGLTYLNPEQIEPNLNLEELLAKVDIHSAEKKQVNNYKKFISFLEENSIPHIYQDAENRDTPYDQKYREVFTEPIEPITNCTLKEAQERASIIAEANYKRQIIYVKRQKKYENIIEQLKKENKNLIGVANVDKLALMDLKTKSKDKKGSIIKKGIVRILNKIKK